MQFLNSKIGMNNFMVIGPMHVVRANTAFDYSEGEYNYETETYEYPETEGWDFCITEVVDWPFTEDDAGVAFPSCYGVRTRTWRRTLEDGGGDTDEYFTAVPKILPSGYTRYNRGEGKLIYGLYADYLGDNPMYGTSWNLKTPTGLLLNDTNDPSFGRRIWTPMNQGTQVYESSMGDAYSGVWNYYGPDDNYDLPETLYIAAYLAGSHVGFRGGKLTFTINATYAGMVPIAGSATYQICAVRIDRYWSPIDSSTEDVVEVLDSGTVSWSFGAFIDPPVVVEKNLGELIPSEIGIPYNFFVRYPYSGGVPIYGSSHVFQLSPRVDVPLWYSSTMGNRIAPGGYVASVSPA